MKRRLSRGALSAGLLFFAWFACPVGGHSQEAFPLPQGQAGVRYQFRIPAEGGLMPLHWKVINGTLPEGIVLDDSGALQGTALAAAARTAPYQFVVEVADSSNPPQRSSMSFALTIHAAPLRIALGAAPLRIVTPATNHSSPPAPEPAASSGNTTVPPGPADPPPAAAPSAGAPAAPPPASPSTSPPSPPAATTTPASSSNASSAPAPENADPCQAAGDRPSVNPLRAWDYAITGSLPQTFSSNSSTTIEVLVDGRADSLAEVPADVPHNPLVDSKTCSFTLWLKRPLVTGEKVRIRPKKGTETGPWSDEVPVATETKKQNSKKKAKSEADCPILVSDCRDPFEASAYLGLAIDTFASGETLKYLNPDVSNGPKERAVAGFDFAYRALGRPTVYYANSNVFWANQLWVYGETVHGVRSTDINCTKNPNFLTCQTALDNPERAPEQILFVIRNASSLEGFAGLRYEFLSLQPRFVDAANLYVKAQAGFLTASGRPSAAVAIHHVGLGAIATKGKFQGSYLEVGYGRNDLFVEKRKQRWKVDAFLSRQIGGGVSFFTQITVDSDIGHGSDSIQTYLGFDFDLGRLRLFGSKKKAAAAAAATPPPGTP